MKLENFEEPELLVIHFNLNDIMNSKDPIDPTSATDEWLGWEEEEEEPW